MTSRPPTGQVPVGQSPVGQATIRRDRIVGIDAARALALVGMFATHLLPLAGPAGGATLTGLVADGRASALFAVLAGVGIALSTGGASRPRDRAAHRTAAAGLLVRAGLVGLLGLLLVGLDPPVAVILAYYGLLFVVAVPLLRLPGWVLAAGAVLAGGLTPVLSQVWRTGGPSGPGNQVGLGALATPGELFTTLALTGYYPVLTWTTYLLAGMAVGRLDLRSVRVAWRLLAGGALLAVAARATSALLMGPGGGAAAIGEAALALRSYGTTRTDTWWWLAVDLPHTGAPLDLVHTTGTALAVLGAMLLLARYARPLALLPAAVGSVPLTLYTVHVVAITAYRGEPAENGTLFLAHVLVAAVIGVVLRMAGLRGPLETLVSAAGRGARTLARGGPAEGRDRR